MGPQSQSRERNFDKIGGLSQHIQVLKEMIIYPLLYREVFDNYGVEAPRGVLFHGPPGTGKTLMAGAVAAECSKSSKRKVSFYIRKGAECLNKYVGESEKHLQSLFAQAHNTRPSIIFFDEIDGLVPTRSESQEVHASVVSTLLALMDGLDSKSEVFVIGATNRIDMIDPALRRPGRFDRELYFPLPSLESRLQIFRIHTQNWKHKPSQEFLFKLASECAGYCGADIQSLCSQAVMKSFHRSYPEISDTSKKYSVNCRNIKVEEEDFLEAKESMIAASQRTCIVPSCPLSRELEPLLQRSLNNCLEQIQRCCPFKFLFRTRDDFWKNKCLTCPRFLLFGKEGQGHVTHLAPAVLHCFDHLPVTVIDLPALNEAGNRNIAQKVEEARQSMPGIIYLRDVSSWCGLVDDFTRQVLTTAIESLDSCNSSQIFLLGTGNASSYEDLSQDVKTLFPKSKSFFLSEPSKEERSLFFSQLLINRSSMPPKFKQAVAQDSDFDLEPSRKKRRQRGLDSEQVIPRPGSYYRKYMDMAGENGEDNDRTRESKSENIGVQKKLKVEKDNICPSSSGAYLPGIHFPEEQYHRVEIDLSRMMELVKHVVDITSNCPINTIIRLYEDLEVVTLRYASKCDRSSLPEELEREVSLFLPT